MDKERRSGGIEKKRSKRIVEKSKLCWNVEHSTVGNEVTTAFTIIFKM
jgi:hypothetical protein